MLKIVKELNLPTHQSYTFVLKGIYRDQRFRNHPKNRKKALKADKRLRTIAGRLVKELKRNLGENRAYDDLLSLFEKILLQRCNSSHKIYSIHEPDVQCISKGKEHKNTNLVTKSPSYALPQVSFLVPALSATNTMGIRTGASADGKKYQAISRR